ncbi:hypothetical protein P5V15_008114 [Pogonomyrmex californicus]
MHHRQLGRQRPFAGPFVCTYLYKRGGVYVSRSLEWNVKRARTFPEERADRSKGIRGAEDGQSGSGASSPRDSERRGGVRERGRKGKEWRQGGDSGRKEGKTRGG